MLSESSISGQTTYACLPLSISSRTKLYTLSRDLPVTAFVRIGLRPAGSSSIAETSISPNRIMARVRGIGVADMTRQSGSVPFSLMSDRCRTPKRCCSSVITSPRWANRTPGWISACVPTTTSTAPDAISSRTAFLSAADMLPISNPTRIPNGEKRSFSPSYCCRARISVGIMNAP